MRENPVEALTLINPSEEPWKVRPVDVALAVGVGAVAIGLYYRRRQQEEQASQPPMGDAMSQTPIWAKGLLLGGLAWFVFYLYTRKESPSKNMSLPQRSDMDFVKFERDDDFSWTAYLFDEEIGKVKASPDKPGFKYKIMDGISWDTARTFAEAQEGIRNEYYWKLVDEALEMQDEDMAAELAADEWEENPRADRYVVKVVGERVLYPQPGSKYFPAGYPLRSAQDFARIGSQTGKTRKIFRGGPRGKHVRTYREGRRVWPRTAAQAKTLFPRERPREFRN